MAFKMMGSAFKLGNVATKSALKQTVKSPLEQDYDNVASIDHKEGNEENIKTHKKNKTETYKSDLNADEINAKLAKTRHLEKEKKEEVTIPEKNKKYPKNEKETKVKKTKSKTKRVKRPKGKSTINLVTGGKNKTYRRTGTSNRR
tara:strand:+ start:49 stop:483 length:435 start_codon:yes stop_codon:yes gene_type:complete